MIWLLGVYIVLQAGLVCYYLQTGKLNSHSEVSSSRAADPVAFWTIIALEMLFTAGVLGAFVWITMG